MERGVGGGLKSPGMTTCNAGEWIAIDFMNSLPAGFKVISTEPLFHFHCAPRDGNHMQKLGENF